MHQQICHHILYEQKEIRLFVNRFKLQLEDLRIQLPGQHQPPHRCLQNLHELTEEVMPSLTSLFN